MGLMMRVYVCALLLPAVAQFSSIQFSSDVPCCAVLGKDLPRIREGRFAATVRTWVYPSEV